MATSPEQPFTLSIPDAALDNLHQKLALTRLPDELDDAGWEYGVPLAHVRRLLSRWTDGYDWRKCEAEINKLPMFARDVAVDGFGTLNVHYVHQKSAREGAIPLFFSHGWPGHFLEARKILPLLTAPESPDYPAFHVVVVSLPGFPCSEAPKKKGFGAAQFAEVCHKVMLALGYPECVCQGGDWGYTVTRMMAAKYGPKHVKAWHTNVPFGVQPQFTKNPLAYLQWMLTPYTAAEKNYIAREAQHRATGTGYFQEHTTQPQTIGYLLADSPVGLLAWIYEKLIRWTDAYPWTDDEVLDWISLYWLSRAGPAATVRIYYEIENDPNWFMIKPTAPMGVSWFPKDILLRPKAWVRLQGNVVFESEHTEGGHFAAIEKPELLAGDVRAMFGKGGPAYSAVAGKHGY